MKKKIILAAGAVLLAASVAVAVYAGKTKTAEQMLFEANVEALMRSEDLGRTMCVKNGRPSEWRRIHDCSDCTLTYIEIVEMAYCD